jgi:hypothetical protein
MPLQGHAALRAGGRVFALFPPRKQRAHAKRRPAPRLVLCLSHVVLRLFNSPRYPPRLLSSAEDGTARHDCAPGSRCKSDHVMRPSETVGQKEVRAAPFYRGLPARFGDLASSICGPVGGRVSLDLNIRTHPGKSCVTRGYACPAGDRLKWAERVRGARRPVPERARPKIARPRSGAGKLS